MLYKNTKLLVILHNNDLKTVPLQNNSVHTTLFYLKSLLVKQFEPIAIIPNQKITYEFRYDFIQPFQVISREQLANTENHTMLANVNQRISAVPRELLNIDKLNEDLQTIYISQMDCTAIETVFEQILNELYRSDRKMHGDSTTFYNWLILKYLVDADNSLFEVSDKARKAIFMYISRNFPPELRGASETPRVYNYDKPDRLPIKLIREQSRAVLDYMRTQVTKTNNKVLEPLVY